MVYKYTNYYNTRWSELADCVAVLLETCEAGVLFVRFYALTILAGRVCYDVPLSAGDTAPDDEADDFLGLRVNGKG